MTSRVPPPRTPTEAIEQLERVAIAAPVRAVLESLQRQGHAAVLVGGAVRDALRGVQHGDWDVASSATPEQVQELFRHTIPTGVQHGTVTVVAGAGDERTSIEVTTFRGEGDYLDGRRPSEVQFHDSLEDDLARRDFTINAFAWDPIGHEFSDPFGGLEDLRAGRIRAVGAARERFCEDALRTMRAVRFCATLRFELEPATEAAIPAALPILDQVSRERVHSELMRLLAAERPSSGLYPMVRTGMWPHVLATLASTEIEAAIEAVDRLPPDAIVRIARLLRPAGPDTAQATFERLRPSREQRMRVVALTGAATEALAVADDEVAIRRAAAQLGREQVGDALLVVGADAARIESVERACNGAALAVGDLAIGGRDLVADGILAPGPAIGETLRALLERVLVEPALNDREQLVRLAKQLLD